MALPRITYLGRNDPLNNSLAFPPGFPARIRVELDRPVTNRDNNGQPLRVVLEHSRIVVSSGGFPERVAISDPEATYFTADGFAKTFDIPVGRRTGVSGNLIVRDNPTQNGRPVSFPDDVLISGYIGDITDGNIRSHILTVDPRAVVLDPESASGVMREVFPSVVAGPDISDRATPITDGTRNGLEWTWTKEYHHLLGRITAPCRLRVWDDGLVEGHMEDCRNLLNPLPLEFTFAVELIVAGPNGPQSV